MSGFFRIDFAQRVLADVVFDERQLRHVVGVRIARQRGNIVHGGSESDAAAPDMRRQAQVLEIRHQGDGAALPEPAAEGQVGLQHIHGAALDEALEVERGIERLAGRDRDGADPLQCLIAGEILRRERLLDPADAVLGDACDAFRRSRGCSWS